MKYVLVNWSYNEPGRWLSISSTDYQAAQYISSVVCDFIKSYKTIRYDMFSTSAGLATIEEIETDDQASDINGYLTDFFTSNGWKADKRASYSYSKIS
jgi:hypothetical protein